MLNDPADWAEDDVRASDAEREQVVAELRRHVEEGRLTLEEFRQRLDEVYAARTRRELGLARRELPRAIVPRHATLRFRDRVTSNARYFVGVATPSLVCVGVWAASGRGSFWPGWVMLASGALALRRFARRPRTVPAQQVGMKSEGED